MKEVDIPEAIDSVNAIGVANGTDAGLLPTACIAADSNPGLAIALCNAASCQPERDSQNEGSTPLDKSTQGTDKPFVGLLHSNTLYDT
jgi:hypothetical protein